MDPVFQSLAVSIGLPVLTAGIVLVLAAVVCGRQATFRTTAGINVNGAVAMGCGLGFVLAFYYANGWKGWPPKDTLQWLSVAVFPAILLGIVEGHTRFGVSKWRWLLRVLLLGGLLVTQLLPRYRYQWKEEADAVLYTVVLLALWMVFYASLEGWLERLKAGWAAFALMVLASAVSVTLALSSSASLGQTTGMAAAAAGAVWFVTLIWRRSLAWKRGALAIFGMLLPALMLNGRFYSELKTDCALLLLASPVVGWLIGVGLQRWFPGRRWIGAAPLAGLLTAIAAVILAWSRYESPTEYEW